LHDFVESSGFRCVDTENLIRDLVSSLAWYREEDVPLFPNVFMLAQRGDLSSLAPGVISYRIGEITFGPDASSQLLKNTAGLAAHGWAVYAVKRETGSVEYGVFRSQRHSFATNAEESMQDLGEAVPVILIRNRGHLTVELLNTKKDQCTVTMTSATPASSQLADHVLKLAEVASSGLDRELRQRFAPYFGRYLTAVVQQCHGALIAILDGGITSKPAELADGVWIEPTIDIAEKYKQAVSAVDAESLADLQAAEYLLAGMIHNDGVVVLDSNGAVRAFRVFLTPNEDEKKHIPDKGGGRRRTYSLMKHRVTAGSLLAALFRSEDGETGCERRQP
jgi:hypothetical protein